MDLFEQIVEYKNDIKEATKLFAMLSAMNAQMDEAFDKLLPIMVKMQNPPLATQQDKEQYKNDLEIVVAALKMQQQITATSETAYYQTAVELNKLLKELEVEE